MKSKIVITQDYEQYINDFKDSVKICKVYLGDEFLLDDAKQIMQNAYLIEEYDKYFILAYKNYSDQAQNFMLKLLEEPPTKVHFILLVHSKNLLLPTIKSRLISEKINSAKNSYELNLDLKRMSLMDINNLNIDKATLSDFISALLKECYKQDLRPSAKLLDEFCKCYELSKVHTNAKIISLRLLLGIMRERG